MCQDWGVKHINNKVERGLPKNTKNNRFDYLYVIATAQEHVKNSFANLGCVHSKQTYCQPVTLYASSLLAQYERKRMSVQCKQKVEYDWKSSILRKYARLQFAADNTFIVNGALILRLFINQIGLLQVDIVYGFIVQWFIFCFRSRYLASTLSSTQTFPKPYTKRKGQFPYRYYCR